MLTPPVRDRRQPDQLRPVAIERGAARNAEGSCLISFGETRVLCAVSVEDGVPGWRKGRGQGWLTAEYSMLPRSTRSRTARERGQVGGRTQEIQRLIGRSVRAMIDDFSFGEFTLKLDCDVLDADGGTRTAAITGAAIATWDAVDWMLRTGRITRSPLRRRVAAVSVGLIGGEARLDLEYDEDVVADVDMNVVMTSEGKYIEVQGTAEHAPFDRVQLDGLLDLAGSGIRELLMLQDRAMAAGG